MNVSCCSGNEVIWMPAEYNVRVWKYDYSECGYLPGSRKERERGVHPREREE